MGSWGVSRDCPDAKPFEVNGRELPTVEAGRIWAVALMGSSTRASQVGVATRQRS